MKKPLSYFVFAVLGTLLILTLLYESGSSFPACQAWGSFISGWGMGHHGMMRRGPGFNYSLLIFLLMVFLLAYLLLREDGEEKPIQVLNRRLARGEVSPEEYKRIKRELLEE